MTTAQDANTADAAILRSAMVDELVAMGVIRTRPVLEAAKVVPRHVFAPAEPMQRAYAPDKGLVTKRDDHGKSLSSVSAAHIQVAMLEQAEIEPGMRVLEIGSGGYNAALIAKLVGPSGHVVSVDIDPDIVDRAREYLTVAGYDRVVVLLADAEDGVADHAPFDRVIVTAGAWDVPPAWPGQLSDRGRIVVPLRIRGLTRSVVLEQAGGRLVSRGYRLCGFVPMQGAGARDEQMVALDGDQVGLWVDEEQALNSDLVRDALFADRVERWSGVEFDHVDELDFWIATTAPASGLLTATRDAIERGLVAPSTIRGVPAAVDGDSFAYRTKRPVSDTGTFETGVYAHGPSAEAVAERYVRQLRLWDSTYRGRPGARIEVYPAGTPVTRPAHGCVVDKKHNRIVISWPTPADSAPQ